MISEPGQPIVKLVKCEQSLLRTLFRRVIFLRSFSASSRMYFALLTSTVISSTVAPCLRKHQLVSGTVEGGQTFSPSLSRPLERSQGFAGRHQPFVVLQLARSTPPLSSSSSMKSFYKPCVIKS